MKWSSEKLKHTSGPWRADRALRAHLGIGTSQYAGIGIDRLLHATSRLSDSAVTVVSST